jgi:uncharacterized protein (DUF1015 family)
MKIAPFRALYPDIKFIKSADSFFNAVKYEYPQYLKNGFYKKTAQEGYYLYEIDTGNSKHLGLVATLDINDYINEQVKIHEHTLAPKEQKTTDLILERKATIKPILLSYPRNEGLHALLEDIRNSDAVFYEINFEEDDILHRIWKVIDGDIMEQINQYFEQMSHVYIADGHHRTASMANLYEMSREKKTKLNFQWLHTAFFSFDQLQIQDYNRVVSILEDLSPTQLMSRLSQYFNIREIKKARKPEEKFCLTMLINKEWYELRWKEGVLEKYKDEEVLLDAALFDRYVLGAIMGVKDIRNDDRINYVGGSKGLDGIRSKMSGGENNVAFCLPPVQTEEFVKVSDAGKTLPPKSTWFEPRLRNGLIVHSLKSSL